jgi:REP-associated tyrosine transposase
MHSCRSVHAQLGEAGTSAVTDTAPLRSRYADFAALIAAGEDADMSEALRQAETVGARWKTPGSSPA